MINNTVARLFTRLHVKIIQCADTRYWYADCIGNVYKVRQVSDDFYVVCDTERWICKQDCEIMEVMTND